MGNLTVKESGEMINFISPNISNITSFKVHFSPRQEGSGDPSPDNVREITGWNGVEGYSCGKNLFDSSKIINDARLNQYGELLRNAEDVVSDYIKVQPLNIYAISGFGNLAFNERHCWYDKDKNYLKASANISSDVCTLTVPSDAEYVRLTIKKDYIESTQIELGSQTTSYQPYQGVTTSIDWTEDIGTVYGGYVDLVSGELVNEYASIVLTGTEEGWQFYGAEIEGGHIFSNSKVTNRIGGTQRRTEEFCTHFPMSRNWKTTLNTCIVGESGLIGFTVDNSIAETVEEFTQFLSEQYANGTPVQFVYKIYVSYYANYTTYQLTQQQLSTLKGQNNFWSNADYVEIEYELTETFDIQKAKRKIILNQPHVESASGDLVTFNTDMKGKLKECKVYFSPVQEGEGDPSLDNVRNIVGWNGVSVYSPSENLIPSDIPAQFYCVNPSASDGHFKGSGVAYSTFIIPVPKGKICLARTTRDFLSYGALCDEPPTVGSNAFNVVTMTNRNSHVFDNSDGHKYFAITTNRSVEINSNWEGFLSTEPRLTIGDVAQPYTTPTNISTYSIDWTDSAGTVYGGYVDLVSGELVQTHWGFVADGENIKVNRRYAKDAQDMFGAGIVYNTPTGISSNNISRPTNIYCNKIPVVTNEKIDIPYIYTPNAGALYMVFYVGKISEHPEITSKTDTLNFVNNWLQENPLQIIYQLATPIHYQLTPQQLTALRGTNNIYSNTNGQTEIKYWKH